MSEISNEFLYNNILRYGSYSAFIGTNNEPFIKKLLNVHAYRFDLVLFYNHILFKKCCYSIKPQWSHVVMLDDNFKMENVCADKVLCILKDFNTIKILKQFASDQITCIHVSDECPTIKNLEIIDHCFLCTKDGDIPKCNILEKVDFLGNNDLQKVNSRLTMNSTHIPGWARKAATFVTGLYISKFHNEKHDHWYETFLLLKNVDSSIVRKLDAQTLKRYIHYTQEIINIKNKALIVPDTILVFSKYANYCDCQINAYIF